MFEQNISLLSKILEHPDDEPVDNLNKGDDTESQAQSKQSTKIGQEVSLGHTAALFIFLNICIFS